MGRKFDKMYQIKSKYFTAGLFVNTRGVVADAAPILHKAIGMKWSNVESFYRKRGCHIEEIPYGERND